MDVSSHHVHPQEDFTLHFFEIVGQFRGQLAAMRVFFDVQFMLTLESLDSLPKNLDRELGTDNKRAPSFLPLLEDFELAMR